MAVYFIQENSKEGYIKIGSSDNVFSRLSLLEAGNPHGLNLLAAMEGGVLEERATQRKFVHLLVRGEWFRPGNVLLDFIEENGVKFSSEIESDVYDGSRRLRTRRKSAMYSVESVVIRLLIRGGEQTKADLMRGTNVKKKTLEPALRELLASEKIVVRNSGRGVRYKLAE